MMKKKSLSLPGDSELTEVDLEVNAEIMRRLLVFLGMQDLDAKKIIEKPQVIVKAKLINNNGTSIELYEPFDRSWRRVSIALDMIGFLTEDRDRSKGLYYVTYTDLDIGEADKKAKEEEGWLDSIDFWSDDEAEAEEMAEEETGAEDGDIRKKGRRGKKKEDEGPCWMWMPQELLTKVVQIKMKVLDINLIWIACLVMNVTKNQRLKVI